MKLARVGQRILDTLVPSKVWDTDSQLLDALQQGSETLQNITDQFAPLMKNFHIYFFWEQEKTDMKTERDYVRRARPCSSWTRVTKFLLTMYLQVVDEASAAPILDNTDRSGIPADHSRMCKFESPSSTGYKVVLSALIRYERAAPATIGSRWVRAKEMLEKQWVDEAAELIGAN